MVHVFQGVEKEDCVRICDVAGIFPLAEDFLASASLALKEHKTSSIAIDASCIGTAESVTEKSVPDHSFIQLVFEEPVK